MTSIETALLHNEISRIPHIKESIIIATADEPTESGKVYSLEELQECTEGDSRLYLVDKDLWLNPNKVTRPSEESSKRMRDLLTSDQRLIFIILYHSKGEWELVVWWVRNYNTKEERECEYRKFLTPLELTELLYICDYGSFLDRILNEIMKGYKAYK